MAEIVGLAPVWQQAQYFDNDGLPLANGLIWTYASNQDETVTTWTDVTGTIENTNPIVLDASGRMQTEIWLRAGEYYQFVLQDPTGNELARVRTVSVPKLVAGDNIILDPPSGVGPLVTISAAGSVGDPKGHGQTYLFIGNGTGMELYGSNFTALNLNDYTSSLSDPPDVQISNGNRLNFNTAGLYTVSITTRLTTQSSMAWPIDSTVAGVSIPGAMPPKSYHSKYSSYAYDGLPANLQQMSFTDNFVLDAGSESHADISVFANAPAYPSQQVNVYVQVEVTRFGDQLP